jgi:hypothetical protein
MFPLIIAGGAMLAGVWALARGEKCEHTYAERIHDTAEEQRNSDCYSPEMGSYVYSNEVFRITCCTKCGSVRNRQKLSGGTRFVDG